MRYVSEQFKEAQDEIIRPPYSNIRFFVGTDNGNAVNAVGGSLNPLDFDTSVAPVIAPKFCDYAMNHYTVLGDEIGVDNPRRICAPDNSGGSFSKPNGVVVPYGITPYTNANERAMIGDDNTVALNFTGVTSPLYFYFVGGHVPTRIDFETYDADKGLWINAYAIQDLDGIKSVTFYPTVYDENRWYHFEVQATTPGRFQLAYIYAQKTLVTGVYTAVFTTKHISKIAIDEDTDLTSQNLPDYEYSVECLDLSGEYSPESEYWKKYFKEGSPCYAVASYTKNGNTSWVDLFFGKLKEEPNYDNGKITFKVAVDWKNKQTVYIPPEVESSLSAGDEVEGQTFASIIETNNLFDTYDVFPDVSDRLNSKCNHYGEIESDEARQLIANALGCYITADLNAIELNNANDIQYKPICTYITRYDQVKGTLESRAKVGKIVVDKENNTLSAEYVDLTYGSTVNIVDGRTTSLEFVLPSGMTSFGKTALVDAQSTNPDSTVTLYDSVTKFYIDDNGLAHVGLPFTSDFSTPANPIVRFYKVNSDTLQETETLDNEAGEIYQNSNSLVTNSYVAGKVKRVAHLVSDISNQYEVDVIQDLRLELGDVIRLETEKNVYKTCVITGLKFNLPGCHGHLTCRKIFSLLDGDYIVEEPKGLSLSFGVTSIEVDTASEVGCVVGIMNTQTTRYIYVLGVDTYEEDISGTVTSKSYNAALTDSNGHIWKFAYYTVPSGVAVNTSAPVVNIPEYDVSTGASEGCFGAVALLKTLYAEQDMNAPVDYSNDWEVI